MQIIDLQEVKNPANLSLIFSNLRLVKFVSGTQSKKADSATGPSPAKRFPTIGPICTPAVFSNSQSGWCFCATGVLRGFPNNQIHPVLQTMDYPTSYQHGHNGMPVGPRWPCPTLGWPHHYRGE
jgi:hypothetical protein